jgi:uncharacterized membrane protein
MAADDHKLVRLGRTFFAASMVGLGTLHLIFADFVTRMIPAWPAWVPGRSIWARLVGIVLIAVGVLIAVDRKARVAASLLGTIIVLSLLLFSVPQILANPWFGGTWTNPAKLLALCGGAFLLAGLASEPSRARVGEGLSTGESQHERRLLARIVLGGFLMLAGIQHFVYADFVANMVPEWIPGHLFWAYFTGLALLAGGAGLMIERTARAAAFACGVMIFLWFLILHIPRAADEPRNTGEWSGVFESLAISGMAFALAGTRSHVTVRRSRRPSPDARLPGSRSPR